MSQENITCAVCDKECGYDDGAGIWFGNDREHDYHAKICERCKCNLIRRFGAFFGIDCSSDEHGVDVEWHEMRTILDKVKRDYAMRISYITTDRELYEREVLIKTPIEEDIGAPI